MIGSSIAKYFKAIFPAAVAAPAVRTKCRPLQRRSGWFVSAFLFCILTSSALSSAVISAAADPAASAAEESSVSGEAAVANGPSVAESGSIKDTAPAVKEPEPETEVILIDGLTLPCSGCSTGKNGQYVITVHGERIATSAQSALIQLLSVQDPEDYSGRNPTAAELSRFLLGAKRGEPESDLAFQLLFSDSSGRKLLEDQAAAFLSSYPAGITKLIASGEGDEELWLKFWNTPLPSAGGNRPGTTDEGLRLKAAIAARHSEIGLKGLADDILLSDPEKDLARIEILAKALGPLKPEWAAEFERIGRLYSSCAAEIEQQAGKRGFNLFNCRLERISGQTEAGKNSAETERTKIDSATAGFVQRLQAFLVQRFISARQLAPDVVIAAIRQTDFHEHRTPELHQIMFKAVRDAAESNYPSVRVKSAAEENFSMFEVFAQADSTIRRALVVLLNRASLDSWNSNNPDLAVGMLELSFKIFPQSDTSRADFVHFVSLSTVVRNSPELSQRMRSLGIQNVIIEGPDRRLIVGTSAIGVLLMLLIVAYYNRILQLSDPNRPPTAAELKDERDDLLKYFGLAADASEQELTRVFRAKAKELHPDTGGESGAEFSHVVEKYNRLKFLLSGMNEPAAGN